MMAASHHRYAITKIVPLGSVDFAPCNIGSPLFRTKLGKEVSRIRNRVGAQVKGVARGEACRTPRRRIGRAHQNLLFWQIFWIQVGQMGRWLSLVLLISPLRSVDGFQVLRANCGQTFSVSGWRRGQLASKY